MSVFAKYKLLFSLINSFDFTEDYFNVLGNNSEVEQYDASGNHERLKCGRLKWCMYLIVSFIYAFQHRVTPLPLLRHKGPIWSYDSYSNPAHCCFGRKIAQLNCVMWLIEGKGCFSKRTIYSDKRTHCLAGKAMNFVFWWLRFNMVRHFVSYFMQHWVRLCGE